MNRQISPDNARYLEEAVRSGVYRSEADAIDEAIGLLKQRDQLRADIGIGIQQADQGELIPAADVFERLENRAREIEATANEE